MYEYATNTFNNLRREKQVRILTGLLKLMGKKVFMALQLENCVKPRL